MRWLYLLILSVIVILDTSLSDLSLIPHPSSEKNPVKYHPELLRQGSSSSSISSSRDSENHPGGAIQVGTTPANRNNTTSLISSTPLSLREKAQRIVRMVIFLSNTTKFTLQLTSYFFFLYFFTVVYNLSNKKLLLVFPYPFTVTALQTFLGIPLFLPLWILKPPRKISQVNLWQYCQPALCHALGNLCTVSALYTGSISFVHVVKAGEPLFSALLSSVMATESRLTLSMYLSLLPVVAGVGLASARDMTFSWIGLLYAMASNLFNQLRMVLSKRQLDERADGTQHLSASNTFRVITILSTIVLVILAVVFESQRVTLAVQSLLEERNDIGPVVRELLISGASFYLYNEIGFWILDLLHPVSLAVGNAIKRVVLITSSVIFFHTQVDLLGAIGAALAILGSLLYVFAAQSLPPARSLSSSHTGSSPKSITLAV
eukprot:gene8291-9142_t